MALSTSGMAGSQLSWVMGQIGASDEPDIRSVGSWRPPVLKFLVHPQVGLPRSREPGAAVRSPEQPAPTPSRLALCPELPLFAQSLPSLPRTSSLCPEPPRFLPKLWNVGSPIHGDSEKPMTLTISSQAASPGSLEAALGLQEVH